MLLKILSGPYKWPGRTVLLLEIVRNSSYWLMLWSGLSYAACLWFWANSGITFEVFEWHCGLVLRFLSFLKMDLKELTHDFSRFNNHFGLVYICLCSLIPYNVQFQTLTLPSSLISQSVYSTSKVWLWVMYRVNFPWPRPQLEIERIFF